MLESSRLARPVLFLSTKGPGLTWFKFVLPIILSLATCLYLYAYPKQLCLFGDGSLADGIFSFLQILPGFYIASLAAVSTFQGKMLDAPFDGIPITLKTRENGTKVTKALTRRHFLSLLFGYLSFLSIMLSLYIQILNKTPPFVFLSSISLKNAAECASFFVLSLFFFQLITITLLGLFYLSDRMHWKQKEEIVTPSHGPASH